MTKRPAESTAEKMSFHGGKWFFFIYICAVSVWTEFVIKVRVYGFSSLFERGALFTLIFSLSLGIFIATLSTLFSPRANRIIAIVLLSAQFVCVNVYLVYYEIFSVFPSVASTGGAGAIVQFIDITIEAILVCWLPLLLTLLPVVALYFFRRLGIYTGRPGANGRPVWVTGGAGALLSVLMFFFGAGIVRMSDSGSPSPKNVYYDQFVSLLSVRNFGIMTSIRLETQSLAAGERAFSADKAEPVSQEYRSYSTDEYNMIDVDFDTLAQDETDDERRWLDGVFSAKAPTEKNAYTGIFSGKNLVFITAESFSQYAVDPEVTPLLYKMCSEGFRFNNYYSPLWGVSTTDGEYANCQGLIPKTGSWSFAQSAENYLPFVLGNQLSALGYNCVAYHDHAYDFYHRDRSHPNMGYLYKGVGNGLEISDSWPESDSEMFAATIGEYVDSAPFHAYYMTVSGHMNYNFSHNDMSAKNREAVAGLNYSDEAKAYISANLELEYALEELMEQLETRGIAEDTVIVIAADHYPYALSRSAMTELAGRELDGDVGIYKSALIIYNPGMEPVEVDKLCSSVDILPTVSNLFGLGYDSRMLSGSDIFSDSEPIVIFGNHSWLTDEGYYDAYTGRFTPSAGSSAGDDYAEEICSEVARRFEIAESILDTDYYRAVFGG